jgi:GNAT superfamily N-acetyltransferase
MTEEGLANVYGNPPSDAEIRGRVLLDGDAAIGFVGLYLPMTSNSHYAEADLTVDPDHRRRGLGTTLMGDLLTIVRAENRTDLIVVASLDWADGSVRSEAGPDFLSKHGFTPARSDTKRRLGLGTLDIEAEDRLWQEATTAAASYELVSWFGRTPERYIEELARIESMIFDEIPLGDVDLRRREIDADHIRARDAEDEAKGTATVHTIAIHKRTGTMAANTVIEVPNHSEHANQAITIVDPAHRGHRLGLLTKIANLRQLREHCHEVTNVWAENADTNVHMIAINERLGFRKASARISYMLKLAAEPAQER